MHEGHRERMREKYLQGGVDALAEHELFELLLFYSQPRVNTNDIAHRLMDAFHSVNGILDADLESLCSIPGMGKNSGLLIRLIKDIINIYNRGKLEPRPLLSTAMEAGNYIRRLIGDQTKEVFYVFSLDPDGRLISCGKIAEGSSYRIYIDVRLVAEYALRHNAHTVILAHNHPLGTVEPSDEDIRLTKRIQDALSALDVTVTDHIIVGDGYFYSMAAHCLL